MTFCCTMNGMSWFPRLVLSGLLLWGFTTHFLGQSDAINNRWVTSWDEVETCQINGTPIHRLSLEKQRLRTLPLALFELTELQELKLDRNRLTSIEGPWENLPNLVSLTASNNRIETIPEALLELTKLEILNLGNNEIERIPMDIDHLRGLKKLILWSNPIDQYPASLGHMPNLTRLDLMHNVMTAEEIATLKLWVRPEVELTLPAPCGCEIETADGD